MTFDTETERMLAAWVERCRAMGHMFTANDPIKYMQADRNFWAHLLADPIGASVAGVFGEAIVGATDMIASLVNKENDTAHRETVAAGVSTLFCQAGANYLLRRLPNIDTTAAMNEVAKRIYGDK